MRKRLPNRRQSDTVTFQHGGFVYDARVARFEDGRLAEVFLHPSAKSGTVVEAWARDAAILTSLALQLGGPVDVIRHALTRDQSGNAAGPVGALLDLLSAEEAEQ